MMSHLSSCGGRKKKSKSGSTSSAPTEWSTASLCELFIRSLNKSVGHFVSINFNLYAAKSKPEASQKKPTGP